MSPCERCGVERSIYEHFTTYDQQTKKSEKVCWSCYSLIREARKAALARDNYLYGHLHRAREASVLADLTLTQWNETKAHFQHKCAYCQEAPIEVLEHFIPISLGGGTTKWNCVPACGWCNRKKRNKHPALVKNIPHLDIERVREYLMSFL